MLDKYVRFTIAETGSAIAGVVATISPPHAVNLF